MGSLDARAVKANHEKDAGSWTVVCTWTGSCSMTLENKPKGVRRTCRRCDDANDTRTNEDDERSLYDYRLDTL